LAEPTRGRVMLQKFFWVEGWLSVNLIKADRKGEVMSAGSAAYHIENCKSVTEGSAWRLLQKCTFCATYCPRSI